MRDRPDGGKEEKNSVNWSLSRRTVDRSSLSACSSGRDKKGSFQIFRDLPLISYFFPIAACGSYIYSFLLFTLDLP